MPCTRSRYCVYYIRCHYATTVSILPLPPANMHQRLTVTPNTYPRSMIVKHDKASLSRQSMMSCLTTASPNSRTTLHRRSHMLHTQCRKSIAPNIPVVKKNSPRARNVLYMLEKSLPRSSFASSSWNACPPRDMALSRAGW